MAYSGAFHKRTEQPEQPEPESARKTAPEIKDAASRQTASQGASRGSPFDIGSLLKRVEAAGMETDDLLMALILYLMYRESGDKDLLIMLGVMLLT